MPDDIHVLKPDTPLAEPGRQQPEADAATARLYEDLHQSIVRIETESGNGSGFAVDRPGLIATDFHVVAKAKEIKVHTYDGKIYKARIKDVDDIRDLAILEIDGKLPAQVKPLVIGDPSKVKPDDRITALGHPEGLPKIYISPGTFVDNTTFDAFRKATRMDERDPLPDLISPKDKDDLKAALDRSLLYGRVHARHGNSGGPLVDSTGKVIGLSDLTGDPVHYSHTFFTPSTDLRSLLDRPQPKFQFKYDWKGGAFAEEFKGELKTHPLTTLAATGGAGYLGYKGIFGMGRLSSSGAAGLSVLGAMTLTEDATAAWNSTNTRDLLKHSTASMFDTSMLVGGAMRTWSKPLITTVPLQTLGQTALALEGKAAGSIVMKTLSRTGKAGAVLLAVGVLGRIGSEFIPNRLVQTDMSRTDGDVRPPLSLYMK